MMTADVETAATPRDSMRLRARLINLYRRQRDARIMHPRERDAVRRYNDVNRHWQCAARLAGAIERLVCPPAATRPIPEPRAILLANFGHLGDVVMSTAALGIVRRAFPRARIGFLLSSTSQVVLKDHPHIHRLHVLDHWRLERTGESLRVRIPRYVQAARRVAEEIRGEGYDAAVDLRAWWPNAGWVLHLARVPARLGYPCWGFESLLTHPVRFHYARKHETEIQCDALRALPIDEALFEYPPFDMPPASGEGAESIRKIAALASIAGRPFDLLHVASGGEVKNWLPEKWAALADRLTASGRTLLFTGVGPRDAALIDRVIAGRPGCLNVCDKLRWPDLVETVRAAGVVYTVDTVTSHLAVTVGTPCVAILGGMADWLQWGPRAGLRSRRVTHRVPCAPCFHYVGCSARPCLRELSVDAVHAAGQYLCSLARSEQRMRVRGR